MVRPGDRYHVNFTVRILWQAGSQARQISGRCRDLSSTGLRVETTDALEVRATVLVTSETFGRMGHASVRYCRREGMKYVVGLHFNVPFSLNSGSHKAMLDKAVASAAARVPAPV